MTSQTLAPTSTKAAPRRVLLTIVELAALGVLGGGALGFIGGLLGAGFGTLVILGIGLIFLIAAVYVFFGIGWFEQQRVDNLYGFGLTPLRFAQQREPGFVNWLKSLWHEVLDGAMWRAVANFVISTAFGALIARLLFGLIWNVFYAFSWLSDNPPPRPWGVWGVDVSPAWSPLVGLLLALGCLAAIVGIALLSRSISEAIVAGPQRRAALTQKVEVTSKQRAGAVRAADVERTRIERDLHDGVQPRLVSVGMTLGLAQEKIDQDPAAAKALIEEAHTSTKAAITELRQLARGIHASVLDDRGLDAALSALAGRSHIPVHLDVRIDPKDTGGCRDAEAAIYFAIAESLTNAAKHSRASECRVAVRSRPGGTIWARVEDDGVGGAEITPGGGLDGIMNRILAAGGTAQLQSPAGGPTALEVTVPCAS